MTIDLNAIREHSRRKVNIPATVEILLGSGRVFTTGKAMVRDISFTGALIAKMVLKKRVLPAENFRIRIRMSHPNHKGIGALCKPVRFGVGKDFEIGVEFEEFWAGDKE